MEKVRYNTIFQEREWEEELDTKSLAEILEEEEIQEEEIQDKRSPRVRIKEAEEMADIEATQRGHFITSKT